MSKKLIIFIVLILLLIAGGIFWWWQSGKEKGELPTGLPEGIEYATPETGVIEGVVKPAPFNPEDVVVDPETGTKIIKDEIGILFKDDVSEEEKIEIITSINGEIVGYALSGQSVEVKIKGNPSISDLKRIVEELKKNPKVENAILSYVGMIVPKRMPDIGKDPQWKDSWNEKNPGGKNWGLETIYAPSAWDYNDLIKPIKIGIFDIGFAINHEDLRIPGINTNLTSQKINETISKIASLEKRKECVLEEGEVINHGTHVAGIIGALANNEVGITGTVWNCDLSIYEVNLKNFDLIGGMEWLLNRGSKIINLSWGFPPKCSSKEEIAGAQRYYNDVLKDWVKTYNDFLIVQSAGNSDMDAEREVIFNSQLDIPKYEELKNVVVTVGATELNPGKIKSFFTGDWDKTFFTKGKGQYILANFTNYGELVDVVAPGVNIYSTLRDESKLNGLFSSCFDFNNFYGCMSGTSMAAPFVTGVAGLVWGANPNLTAEQVKEIIVNSADRPITYEGREYKILNAKPAVKIAVELVEEAITGPQEPLLEKEEAKKEIPDLIKEVGPAALVPPPTMEEKPKEEKKEKESLVPSPTLEPVALKYRLCPPMNWAREEVDPQIEASLGRWIDENLGLEMRWVSFREGEGIWSTGYLDVLDYAAVEKHFWAVGSGSKGDGFIFYSRDGGTSWELQWREPQGVFSGSHPFIVYFSTEKEGWVGSKDGLYYTQDGGKNWDFCDVSGEGFYIAEYWFYNNQRIVARFAYGGTYESLDGGKDWKQLSK